jgi:Rrf2 family iron-sulfur cluster assembly transcriptional regulator
MRITTKGRYALRAIVNLASGGQDKPIPIKRIAEDEEISPEFLEQIFFRLKKAGIIRSVRGPGGGFMLNQEPGSISLRKIFEAVGEGINLTPCVSCTMEPATCERAENCLVHDVWLKVSDRVGGILDDFTLESIIEERQQKKLAVNL